MKRLYLFFSLAIMVCAVRAQTIIQSSSIVEYDIIDTVTTPTSPRSSIRYERSTGYLFVYNHTSGEWEAYSSGGGGGGLADGDYGDVTVSGSGTVISINDDAVTSDHIATLTADLDAGSNKITNVTDPTSDQDAATKAYVDANDNSGLGWYNVEDYGADGSDTTDDTDEIQAAINAAAANYGGVVYFPNGVYYLTQAPVTSDNNSRNPNSQLYIPAISPTTARDSSMTIELLGESGAFVMTPSGTIGASTPTRTGVVLYSTISSSDSTAAMVGTIGETTAVGQFNFNEIHIKNIEFRVNHTATNGAEISGLNFSWASAVHLENIKVAVDTVGKNMTEPNKGVWGIRMGNTYCSPRQNAVNVKVEGFRYGIIASDHFWSRSSYISYCTNALAFTDAAHSIHFDKVLSQRNTNVFTYLADDNNPFVSSLGPIVTVDDISLEPGYGSNSPVWAQTNNLINDPLDSLRGVIRYYNPQGVTIPGTGGNNLRLQNLDQSSADFTVGGQVDRDGDVLTDLLEKLGTLGLISDNTTSVADGLTTYTPSAGSGVAVNLNNRSTGFFRIDLGSTSVAETVSFSNPNTNTVGRYDLHIDNPGPDTLVFPNNFLAADRDTIGARKITDGIWIDFWYDGSNYITRDTFGDPVEIAAGESPADTLSSVTGNLVFWAAAWQETAYSGGGQVSTINDFSGNSYDLTQATAGERALYQTSIRNSRPAFQFDGANDYYTRTQLTELTDGNDFTIFAVVQPDDDEEANVILSTTDPNEATSEGRFVLEADTRDGFGRIGIQDVGGTTYTVSASTAISNVAHYCMVEFDDSAESFTGYLNGVSEETDTWTGARGSANPAFTIGQQHNNSLPFDGYIFEIIIFDGVLSAGDRALIQDYIENRYNL